jgi:Asp-tRNA(Asn)/Glu-tRNA(Gln) amidotransferase A subunit family amidase
VTDDLHDRSIADLSRLIGTGALSPVELTDALIRRVEQHDGQTHAFITRTFDLARRQARQAESEMAAGPAPGPLHAQTLAPQDH